MTLFISDYRIVKGLAGERVSLCHSLHCLGANIVRRHPMPCFQQVSTHVENNHILPARSTIQGNTSEGHTVI